MTKLNPEQFIYELYESSYWSRLGFPYSDSERIVAAKVKECAIGWCDASRLQVRPRPGMIAVMCEDEDGKFWFHQNRECYECLDN